MTSQIIWINGECKLSADSPVEYLNASFIVNHHVLQLNVIRDILWLGQCEIIMRDQLYPQVSWCVWRR